MEFADRLVELQRAKKSVACLGVDPQLDTATRRGLPDGHSLLSFCSEIIEAAAEFVVAIKPQLAFFEARGIEGMSAFREVVKLARRLDLVTIADAKRGDIGTTSAAYAEAFLGNGDFGCDAVTINPYLGGDTIAPFVARVRGGRGVFVLVRNSNPSAAEFQELAADGGIVWEKVAERVAGWGGDFVGKYGLSSVGAVVGATYPAQATKARALMPHALILVPGYGAQGAGATEATASAQDSTEPPGLLVSASRSLMYAYLSHSGSPQPGDAARVAARQMRDDLNRALELRGSKN
jgi:orotidine-5'-phosphate decarboxylase